MADWDITPPAKIAHFDGTYEIAATADVSNHTKGTYTQLFASTPFSADCLMIFSGSSTASRAHLFDIALGTDGNEQVAIQNIPLQCTGGSTVSNNGWVFIPLEIPQGSRVAFRTQSSTGGATLSIGAKILKLGYGTQSLFGHYTTYGANTGTTRGTSVDCGTVANARGAYSEITAGTTASCRALLVFIGLGTNTNGALAHFAMDIAIGPSSQEQIIAENIGFSTDNNTNSGFVFPWAFYIPVHLPLGTRIAVRGASQTVDATDRLFDVVIVGVG